MAFDLGGIFGGLFGQQEAPAATPTTSQTMQQILPQIIGMAPQLAQANLSAAQTTVPGAVDLLKTTRNQLNPQYGQIQSTYAGNILRDLGLGGQLPKDLWDKVLKGAMSQNVSSGWGQSAGGQQSQAAQLGLTSLDLENRRMNAARGWLADPTNNPFVAAQQMPQAITMGEVMGLGSADAAQAARQAEAEAQAQNASNIGGAGSILNLLGTIGGGVLGGMTGTGWGGSAASILNGILTGRPPSIPALGL